MKIEARIFIKGSLISKDPFAFLEGRQFSSYLALEIILASYVLIFCSAK